MAVGHCNLNRRVVRARYCGNIPSRGGHIVNVYYEDGPVVCEYVNCAVRDGMAYFGMNGFFAVIRADERTYTEWNYATSIPEAK